MSANFPTTMATTKTRQTAEERREAITGIAYEEFAVRGLHGTPTSEIAKKAGISHAYLFRLFPTKTDLFLSAVGRCFERTYETFRKAAEGKDGEEALEAMGHGYVELLNDRTALLAQMQGYVACDDPEIRAAVQKGYGELVQFVKRASGLEDERIQQFFAIGMLLNAAAAMNLPELDEDWVSIVLPHKLAPEE
ncbi:MAG: TetR/AcrR family transcriptional regulator [Thermoleophilaceae bacterium]